MYGPGLFTQLHLFPGLVDSPLPSWQLWDFSYAISLLERELDVLKDAQKRQQLRYAIALLKEHSYS